MKPVENRPSERKSSAINLAHVKQDTVGKWIEHVLEDHLREVGNLAGDMASGFKSESWARVAGLWHDLGKYRPAFQGYIKQASGFDPEAHIEQAAGKVDHSTAGAIYATQLDKASGKLLAYLIAGHHAGLPNGETTEGGGLEFRRLKTTQNILKIKINYESGK